MSKGESGVSRWSSPETQSRATEPLSIVRRHSRRNLTFGRDRKKAAKIVSTWRFQPIKGYGLYGRSRDLNEGRKESPVMTSSDGWGRWSSAITTEEEMVALRGRIWRKEERGDVEPKEALAIGCVGKEMSGG